MKLTPEGRTFYSYVSAGCAQFFKGENDLSNLISLENGTIYISATETALHCFLFRAMGEFNSIYPNVHFKILNNSTMDSVNAVKEELSTYPWISLTSEALTRKFLNNYFADHGLQFLPDMELATTDLILPAVRHNLGIGFVPEEFAEEEKKAENVFEIEVEEKLPTRNF